MKIINFFQEQGDRVRQLKTDKAPELEVSPPTRHVMWSKYKLVFILGKEGRGGPENQEEGAGGQGAGAQALREQGRER